MKNNLMLEMEVEKHLCKEVARIGGRERKIQYVGRRGCADRLVGYRGMLYLVELKRPKGGVVSIQQSKDGDFWMGARVGKEYLYTIDEVNAWIGSIT